MGTSVSAPAPVDTAGAEAANNKTSKGAVTAADTTGDNGAAPAPAAGPNNGATLPPASRRPRDLRIRVSAQRPHRKANDGCAAAPTASKNQLERVMELEADLGNRPIDT